MNVTHRKRMDIMKNEFISTVNHECRPPLTSIQGSLGLLKIKTNGSLETKSNRSPQSIRHYVYKCVRVVIFFAADHRGAEPSGAVVWLKQKTWPLLRI